MKRWSIPYPERQLLSNCFAAFSKEIYTKWEELTERFEDSFVYFMFCFLHKSSWFCIGLIFCKGLYSVISSEAISYRLVLRSETKQMKQIQVDKSYNV